MEQRRHLLPLLDFICFVSKQSDDEQLRFPRRLNGSLTDRLHFSVTNTSANMLKSSVNDKVNISLGHVVTRQHFSSLGNDLSTTSRKRCKTESNSQVDDADAVIHDRESRANNKLRDVYSESSNVIADVPCYGVNLEVNDQINGIQNSNNRQPLFDLRDKRAKTLKKLYIGKECLFLNDCSSTFIDGCIIDIDAREGKAQIVPYDSVNKDII